MIVDRHGRRHYPAGTPDSRGGEFAPTHGAGWIGRVSDRMSLPSARKLLQDPDVMDIPELSRELEGRYGRGGRMVVRNVGAHKIGGGRDDALSVFSPHGHLDISGEISTGPDDPHPGYFRVTASRTRAEKETDPLRWVGHIDRMHAHEAGGSGGGRELTQRFIDWFRDSGFDEVTVGPSEVGNYAWGAMGFDFEDHESRRIAWEGAMTMTVESVRDWFGFSGRSYGLSDDGLTDAQIKKMIGQYRRATTLALSGGMSYQRLSQYGRRGRASSDWWAGKLGLLVGGVGGGRIKL